MKKSGALGFLLLPMLAPVTATAQEYLQDPRTRNESIADTEIDVHVSQTGKVWLYEYAIKAGNANVGTINFFEMDLLCEGTVDDRDFDPAPWSMRPYENLYAGDDIVPVALSAENGASWGFDVTATGKAMFAVKVPPGTVNGKLRVYSAYGPGKREYTLQPFFPIDERWNYEGIEEGEPGVPTLRDFQVTGLVVGPACPGNETDGE